MEQEVKLSREEEVALEQIDEVTSQRASTGNKAVALESVDLCEKYKTIKGPLKILVGLLRKFGGAIGKKAADAIEFLMSLADTVCPV